MPMLFCFAIHNALAEVKCHLVEGEHLFAFLDDICANAPPPSRTCWLHRLAIAGIQLHEGKTRVWNRAEVCPMVSSTWVRKSGVLHAQERKMWQAISWVPDLQCAWQIFIQCAARSATKRSMATWPLLLAIVSLPRESPPRAPARNPGFGGLAMRSAMRMSHAAYWASWADVLHMTAERLPQVADQVLAELAQDTNQVCIGELREAAQLRRFRGQARMHCIEGWSAS